MLRDTLLNSDFFQIVTEKVNKIMNEDRIHYSILTTFDEYPMDVLLELYKIDNEQKANLIQTEEAYIRFAKVLIAKDLIFPEKMLGSKDAFDLNESLAADIMEKKENLKKSYLEQEKWSKEYQEYKDELMNSEKNGPDGPVR